MRWVLGGGGAGPGALTDSGAEPRAAGTSAGARHDPAPPRAARAPTRRRRYGVWADWDAPYVTLDPAYEAAQLRVFGQMVLNGHIYR